MRRLLALCLCACSDGTEQTNDAGNDVVVQNDASGDSSPNLDQYGPWFGGYKDTSYFPISVWLQSPSNASAYGAIGINQ